MEEERRRLVDSVCEYIYRLRPLAEWTRFSANHALLKEWLLASFDTLQFFRDSYPPLVEDRAPLKRRVVASKTLLTHWLTCGLPRMALRRAQF